MKILHIANDFSLTKVHSNLYRTLDQMSVKQVVFNPVREETPVGANHIDFLVADSQIVYSKKLRKYHRLLFRRKIAFLYRDLKSKVDLGSIRLMHATTLFSDGALALKIKKTYGIPYIVAVRATDIDVFLKYRPDLAPLVRKILREASRIIFISKSLHHNFLNHKHIQAYSDELKEKCIVVYNGIDDFWLDNTRPRQQLKPSKILFVGRMIGRKHLENLALAVIALNERGVACSIDYVGSGGAEKDKIEALSLKHPESIRLLGAIHDKSRLQEVYRDNHIFAMPSKGETFGLVYIEALSQGLPVLYHTNEGIDGVFNFKVGESCIGQDIGAIANSLELMMRAYDSYALDKIDFSLFRWKNIARRYYDIYTSIHNS